VTTPIRTPQPGALRGVVLAGGTGQRLLPLTASTNKHLLPIGSRRMIDTPVDRLFEAGIRDIAVVSDPAHLPALAAHLATRTDLDGIALTWVEQPEPQGIAQALGAARAFAAGSPVVVILGDNLFNEPLAPHIAGWRASGRRAQVLLAEVADPERFGVARFDGDTLVELVEKPAVPPSNLAVTGIYCYDAGVFDLIATLPRSARGEYEITDLNARYLALGELTHGRLGGIWMDVGTHASYALANHLAAAGR
jgi:glucose-1-phosphate thymidylyltransferase